MAMQERVREAIRYFADGDVDMDDYELIDTGEQSVVVRCPPPWREVLKIPRDATSYDTRSSVRFEAGCLDALQAAPTPPPLPIPEVIECNDDVVPHWLAIQPLPGQSLNVPTAYSLSPEDHKAMGRAVGEFAAWLAVSMDQQVYADIL